MVDGRGLAAEGEVGGGLLRAALELALGLGLAGAEHVRLWGHEGAQLDQLEGVVIAVAVAVLLLHLRAGLWGPAASLALHLREGLGGDGQDLGVLAARLGEAGQLRILGGDTLQGVVVGGEGLPRIGEAVEGVAALGLVGAALAELAALGVHLAALALQRRARLHLG